MMGGGVGLLTSPMRVSRSAIAAYRRGPTAEGVKTHRIVRRPIA